MRRTQSQCHWDQWEMWWMAKKFDIITTPWLKFGFALLSRSQNRCTLLSCFKQWLTWFQKGEDSGVDLMSEKRSVFLNISFSIGNCQECIKPLVQSGNHLSTTYGGPSEANFFAQFQMGQPNREWKPCMGEIGHRSLAYASKKAASAI